jgi:uncharacterized protein (TIGR02246 family)
MIKTTALLLATAVAVTAGTAEARTNKAAPQCAPVTEAAVESQFTRFNEAWATKNADTVTNLFAKEGVLLATVSNVPRTDHAAIKDYFVSFLKGEPVGTINTSTIKLGCNLAYRMGTWTVALTNQNSGVRNNVKARYTFIYTYEDGQWKVAHLHSSMMPVSEG